ncbi:MAG TPA: hypothetical protein VH000_10600 [Rhizomicrobium sp.]|jgi:hypothetical protein|nr:hypothetical protein [Rhizomicrobium sp.]
MPDIGLTGDILRTGGVIAAFDKELARGAFELAEAVGLLAARPCLIERRNDWIPPVLLCRDFRPGTDSKSIRETR